MRQLYRGCWDDGAGADLQCVRNLQRQSFATPARSSAVSITLRSASSRSRLRCAALALRPTLALGCARLPRSLSLADRSLRG